MPAKHAKKGTVIAYEPLEDNYQLLIRNIVENNVDRNVSAYMKAISGKAGKRTMIIPQGSYDSASIQRSAISYGIQQYKRVNVESTSLEDVFIENALDQVDLLKMDVEGSEYEIITSVPYRILRKISKIVGEIHIQSDGDWGLLKKTIRKLHDAGFKCKIYDLHRGGGLCKTVGYFYAIKE